MTNSHARSRQLLLFFPSTPGAKVHWCTSIRGDIYSFSGPFALIYILLRKQTLSSYFSASARFLISLCSSPSLERKKKKRIIFKSERHQKVQQCTCLQYIKYRRICMCAVCTVTERRKERHQYSSMSNRKKIHHDMDDEPVIHQLGHLCVHVKCMQCDRVLPPWVVE
jgi:hypothetical protein